MAKTVVEISLPKTVQQAREGKREELTGHARFFSSRVALLIVPNNSPTPAWQADFLTSFSILFFCKESTNAQVGRFYERHTWISRRLLWTGYVLRTNNKREESYMRAKSRTCVLSSC